MKTIDKWEAVANTRRNKRKIPIHIIPRLADIRRFFDSVKITHTCWLWKGTKTNQGYSIIHISMKRYRAHRFSYLCFKGDLHDDLVIDHICRNQECVNPLHLRQVTQDENVLSGRSHVAENKRKTHCKRGHEFIGENLILKPTGMRACLACQRMHSEIKNKAVGEKRRIARLSKIRYCKLGHPLAGENLYKTKDQNYCRICKTERSRRSNQKRKALTDSLGAEE